MSNVQTVKVHTLWVYNNPNKNKWPDSLHSCRGIWFCSATTYSKPWPSSASLQTSRTASKWSRAGKKIKIWGVCSNSGMLILKIISIRMHFVRYVQCAIWHPAWQRGVHWLQKWPGVNGLQGKEWPFDGGESWVCLVLLYFDSMGNWLWPLYFLGINKSEI